MQAIIDTLTVQKEEIERGIDDRMSEIAEAQVTIDAAEHKNEEAEQTLASVEAAIAVLGGKLKRRRRKK